MAPGMEFNQGQTIPRSKALRVVWLIWDRFLRYSLRAILKYGRGTCFFGLALDKENILFARQMSWSYQMLHKYCTPERIMYLKAFHLFGELYSI